MQSLRQFYNENPKKFNFTFNTLLSYVKKGMVKEGLFIVKNEKRNSYYIKDKDLFLSNFK